MIDTEMERYSEATEEGMTWGYWAVDWPDQPDTYEGPDAAAVVEPVVLVICPADGHTCSRSECWDQCADLEKLYL